MSNEQEQRAQRLAKLDALQELGVDPYPHRFERTGTISAVVAAHRAKSGDALEQERPQERVAGRILGIRTFGKANFLVLSDGLERLQLYLRADSLPERDMRLLGLLDFGDHVGAAGRVFRTKTNELTIWASELAFLAKCR